MQAALRTVAHALVASLTLRETVATNYDGLYKAAVRAAGRELAVLPGSPRSDGAPWLLKLHGSASAPETIVITRQDHVRYHGTRSALRGIVQAMLLTRHMLFVGFSLTDDDVHAVVDTVRQAVDGDGAPSHERGRFGTALFVDEPEAARVLWRRDIDVIGMDSAGDPPAAARHLEIFLDYLARRSVTPAAHVLDDAFETLLTERDRAVRDGLRALERIVADPEAGAEYEPIRSLLRSRAETQALTACAG